jgi:hypothetical protein
MAEINEITTKDALTVRDDVLRTIKNGLIKQGVTNPQVGPNSDWFIIATALGNEIAVVQANAIVKADQQMPDTAILDDLKRIATLLDLEKQPAAGSIGSVTITASATSPIVTGAQLTDAAGLRYEVTVGGNYADDASVPIRSVDTGYDTNHAAGDILRWVSAPPFCDDSVVVAAGGLTNGIDAEDDEVLRARVIAVFQNPPGAGNWEHVAELAEESSASVQKAFVMPAIQGPSTVHVAVAAAPTETSKSRVVATSTMNGTVEPFIKGKLPTHAHVVVTTVSDVSADVAIGLSLPEAPTASPPGPGGGWTNGTPWPSVDGVTYFRVTVTTATSSTELTVDAQTAPTAGVSRVAWLSTVDWKLKTALVTAYTGTAGAYVITLDTPFTGIAAGAYIWPECQNAQTYVDAVLEAFALMGPGEKSTNASALVRGFRHPPPSNGWPYAIGPAMLRAISDAGDEVLDTTFLHRTDGTTTKTGSGGVLTPQVPLTITNPPNILVPRNVGFWRIA